MTLPSALWLALSLGAPLEPLQLAFPIAGFSDASATEVVVTHARPDLPVTLNWLGLAWPLWPNEAGRAGVFLPLLPPRSTFEVEQAGVGSGAVQVVSTARAPDLVVVASWEPGARFDLKVTDPSGEACDAANRRTAHGGVRLRDDPEAPGPHVFLLPRAQAGDYRVALVCGRLPSLAGLAGARVHAFALLQPGTPNEERRDLSTVILRCDEVAQLGVVELSGRGPR